MDIRRKTFNLKRGQDRLLQRLGAAIIIQWDDLPDAMQDLLIDQAVAIDDDTDPAPTRESLETFVRSVRAKDTPSGTP